MKSSIGVKYFSPKSWQNKILNEISYPDKIEGFKYSSNHRIREIYFIMIQIRVCGYNTDKKKKTIRHRPVIITNYDKLNSYLNKIITKDYADEFSIFSYDGYVVYPSFRILVVNNDTTMFSFETLEKFTMAYGMYNDKVRGL